MELIAGQYYHICNRTNNEEALFRNEENYLFFLKKYRYYLDDFFETIAYCLMPTHFHFLVRVKEAHGLNSPGDYKSTGERYSEDCRKNFSPVDFQSPGECKEKKLIGLNSSDDYKSADERLFEAHCLNSTGDLKSTGERHSEKCRKNFSPVDFQSPGEFRPNNQIAILLRSYTRAFNKAYSRHGSLFQQNTKAINIGDEKYLLTLLVYIHQNPIRSGLVSKAEDWPFSSYQDYLEIRKGTLPSKQLVANYYKTVEEFKRFSEEQIKIVPLPDS